MASNSTLGTAKAAKNDEFYTQLPDIEHEMQAYVDYDPDVFRDKTILMPCDDPEWSNFTRYFAHPTNPVVLIKAWKNGAADIFRGLDVSLIHWLQIRSWLGRALLKENSFLNQNQKNLFVSTPRAKALCHFRFEGL